MRGLLISLVVLVVLQTVNSASDDPCSPWPTCETCITHQLCGWCSNPVIYSDGTQGAHCAGFNQTDPKSKPFRCEGRYQTSSCTVGYLCNSTTLQCYKTIPGSGDDLATCQKQCQSSYACDETKKSCYVVGPGNGTSLPVCQASCFQPYTCAPENFTCVPTANGGTYADCSASCGKHSNVTPANLIGNWRGIQVNLGYIHGEFDFMFNESNVVIQFPKQTGVVLVGSVSTILNPAEVWIYVTQGPPVFLSKTLRGIYAVSYAPEVEVYTLAFGGPDQPAPLSFDAAMRSGQSESVFVVGKCLNPQICSFHLGEEAMFYANKKSYSMIVHPLVKNSGINDTCMQYTTCPDCIDSGKYCGWCSNDVRYDDGTLGKHCAGFNPDGSKNPFTCDGTYSTESCPTISPNAPVSPARPAVPAPPSTPQTSAPVAPTFICVSEEFSCVPTEPGHGTSLEVCKQICVPPGNNTPAALIGKWRGIQINLDYLYGEFDVSFNKSYADFSFPNGSTFTSVVLGDASQLWLKPINGPYIGLTIKGIWQIAYSVETKIFSWAWGLPGGSVPQSFAEAMDGPGQSEYMFVGCTNSAICNFDH